MRVASALVQRGTAAGTVTRIRPKVQKIDQIGDDRRTQGRASSRSKSVDDGRYVATLPASRKSRLAAERVDRLLPPRRSGGCSCVKAAAPCVAVAGIAFAAADLMHSARSALFEARCVSTNASATTSRFQYGQRVHRAAGAVYDPSPVRTMGLLSRVGKPRLYLSGDMEEPVDPRPPQHQRGRHRTHP
jgi:hypothetical protein